MPASKAQGTLHIYHPKRDLLLFEHTPSPSTPSQTPPKNTLLFIGGMYDNFLLPNYTTDLAALFPLHTSQTWSIMHAQLTSAGRGFGTSSLDRDIDEIATAITYIRTSLRSAGSPIVLMGHSTGCQDVLHYLSAPNPTPISSADSDDKDATPRARPAVQGAILQAPVSDRDAAADYAAKKARIKPLYDAATKLALTTPKPERVNTVLPLNLTTPIFGPSPLSAARWLSLVSPDSPSSPGADDLFSYDGSASHIQETFGAIGTRGLLKPSTPTTPSLLALISGADGAVPNHFDKEQFLAKWRSGIAGSGAKLDRLSCVVANAKHTVSGDETRYLRARLVELRGRVLRYLDAVVGGVGESAWGVLSEGERMVEELERKEKERKGEAEGVKGVGDLKL